MSLPALAQALREHGGTIATLLTPVDGEAVDGTTVDGETADGETVDGPPQLAARGPRVTGLRAEYELLLEMILEGSLLHYGAPRVLTVRDPDLALLLGDQLYALGLSRLAELGDLEAVAQLADLISLLAQARAAADEPLADAVWRAGAAAIGWGASPEHDAAKALARTGDAAAVGALLASARREGAEGRAGAVSRGM